MASPAVSAPPTGGVSSSRWANQPGPDRAGWAGKGPEPGSAFRGGRGGPKGRGGRGGRGGRAASGKGGPSTKSDAANNKSPPSADPAREKPPSDSQKPPAPAQSTAPPTRTQDSVPPKPSNRSKPQRRGSEQKGSRNGPTLTVDPSVTSASNASTSPSVSPRTPSRRKRGSTQSKTAPPVVAPAVPPVPRKQSLSQDNAPRNEKPPPSKDAPPHLALQQENSAGHFDIKHDIDALVERVRAVAMDRPHTPGSHIDWAGDEDDSLPDLDDWGVPSTSVATASLDAEKVAASVISPILQDTLRPLPTLIDIDIPTPSIRLHEVGDDTSEAQAAGQTDGGDETPRETVPPSRLGLKETDAGSSAAPSSVASHSNTASSGGSRAATPAKLATEASPAASVHAPVAVHADDLPSKDSSPSPDRSLSASIHAMSPSPSAPTYLSSRPPRAGFNPSHNRAHTVGRFKPDHHSDNDRPRRGDAFSHGRNHSTPPTGPGTAHAHARTAHATRPVISVDAISRLAKTLGGAAPPRREKQAPEAAAAKAA